MVELVHHTDSLHLHKHALLHTGSNFFHLFILGKQFHLYGIRKIRNIKGNNGLLNLGQFSGLHFQNLTTDNDFTHLSDDILYLYGFFFKISAKKHLRIIGTDGRSRTR